jgi:predicted neuraminidase
LAWWRSSPLTRGFAEEAVPVAASTARPFYRDEFINPGQEIPMVHVASLADCDDGVLTACWYGGTEECAPDVQIYGAVRTPAGAWSEASPLMTRPQAESELRRPVKSLGNAVLLYGPRNTLRLLYVTIAAGRWSGSQLNCCTLMKPDGTHSPSERLTLSPFFNFSELVRNRPVPLEGGGWCVPIYQEFLGKFPELLWIRGENGFLTARKTRIAGGCSTFQPSLIQSGGGNASVLLRDYTDVRKIFVSRSDSGGLDWTKPVPTNLPNPDAGISGLRLPDGKLLVAYNDSTINRSDLSLATSGDGGVTWKKIVTVESETGATFSYPYLMRSSEGTIRMAYTWKGKRIKMASFNEAWISAREARLNSPNPLDP